MSRIPSFKRRPSIIDLSPRGKGQFASDFGVDDDFKKRTDSKAVAPQSFAVGEKVEAQYKGRSKYYPGRIARVREDGTYDIDYDDGEKETRVREDLIRSLEKRSSSPSRRDGKKDEASDSERDGAIEVGTRVEARYKGRSKYYPGEVVRVRSDGTYDIDYDDGEKEQRVALELIKVLGKSGGREKKGFAVGEKVEAQYKGRSKYYPGRIVRVRGDGTYDIDYDDGEMEVRVSSDYIRALGLKKDDSDTDAGPPTKSRSQFLSSECIKRLRSVCAAYARHSTDSTCRKVFTELDQSQSSSLPKSDFRECLDKIFRGSKTRYEVNDCFRGEDFNSICLALAGQRVGSVNYDDFILFVFDQEEAEELRRIHSKLQNELLIKSKLRLADCMRAFRKHDNKEKGFVKENDFKEVVHKLCGTLSPKESNLSSERWSLSEDGVVDYCAFSSWVWSGSNVDDIVEKLKLQLGHIDSKVFRNLVDKEDRAKGGIEHDRVVKIFSELGLVVTSVEAYAVLRHYDKDGTGTVEKAWLTDLVNQQSSGGNRRRGRSDSSNEELISSSTISSIGEAVKEYLGGKDRSLWKTLAEFDEQKIGQLTKRQYRKLLGELKVHISDADESTLFECLDVHERGTVDAEDLVSLFVTLAYNGDDAEAVTIYSNLGDSKNVSVKEIGRALQKSDSKHDGFVDSSTFETKLKRFFGSNVNDDIIKFYSSFLTSQKSGCLDVGYFVSLMVVASDASRAERKLRHCFSVLESKGVDWKGSISDTSSRIGSITTIDSLAREIKAFGCPLIDSEIFAVLGKHQKKGRINVPSFVAQIEKVETGKKVQSKDSIAGKDGSDLFGKSMFSKICRLRSNKEKREQFRNSMLLKDPDLEGRVARRDFLRTLDSYFELTDQEAALLSENLTLFDEKRESDVGYSLLLLVLMEPLPKPPTQAGTALISKVIL